MLTSKTQRVLYICERLADGKGVTTDELVNEFGIHRATVINYMNEIKSYLKNTYHYEVNLVYDHDQDKYVLHKN